MICLLETDRTFPPSAGLEHWLQPGLRGWRGIALPHEALIKIYRTNLERIYGPAPAPLDLAAALAEVARLAAALDERAGGTAVDNHARQVLEAFCLA